MDTEGMQEHSGLLVMLFLDLGAGFLDLFSFCT